MPYLCIFVEDIVSLLGAITDKWVLTLVCGRNKIISIAGKGCSKNTKVKFIASQLSIKRVVTFGMALYRYQ